MSPTEYQELVTFIGRRVDAVDRRFDALPAHIDERFREFLRHIVGLESSGDKIQRRLPS